MTSPAGDDYAQRLKVAGLAVGTDNPLLAHTLATSGLSASQIQLIGGFSSSLKTNTANNLALDSGVQPNYSQLEQNQLDALKVTPAGQPQQQQDHRNFFEKAMDWVGNHVSDMGWVFTNPVTHAVLTGFDWINRAAHLPWVLTSEAVGGVDTQARDAEMKALGYDPNSGASQFAFLFNHGGGEYHNLSHTRDVYGDHLVDLAVQQQTDPQGFHDRLLQMDPNQAAALNNTLNSEQYREAYRAVDSLHVSPGRDLANLLTAPFQLDKGKGIGNDVFTLLSGGLDAVYDWMADPTIGAGKVIGGIRAADVLGRVNSEANLTTRLMTGMVARNPDGFVARHARGIADVTDMAGMRAAAGLDPNTGKVVRQTAVGEGLKGFLAMAKEFRKQTAIIESSASPQARQAAQLARTRIHTQMDSQYRQLMPLLPEVNGARVLGPVVIKFDEDGALKFERVQPQQEAQATVADDELARLQEQLDLARIELAVRTDHLHSVFPPDYLDDLSHDDQLRALAERENAPESHAVNEARIRYDDLRDRVGELEGSARSAPLATATKTRPAPQAPTDEPAADGFEHIITSRTSGGWEATNGDPITDLQDFVDYMASKGGMMRLLGGEEARASLLMPGKVSWWANMMAARKAASGQKWLEYTPKAWNKMAPTEVELPLLNQMDRYSLDENARAEMGKAQYNLLRRGVAGGTGFNLLRRERVRIERFNRKISTTLPQAREFDLTDPATAKDVERFARAYLNKGDARMLAAAYAAGNLAQRRAVVRGMLQQTFHASGVMQTPAGRAFADRYLADVDHQMYGLKDTDLINTDRGVVHGALYNSQLATRVPLPSLKELNQIALRNAVDGWAARSGMTAGLSMAQSNRLDALYGAVKLGWITQAAGGLRNALDEIAGFMAKGMFSQWLRGRQVYTQAMAQARKDRLAASRAYMQMVKEKGRGAAADEVSQRNYLADQGLEKAQRDLERAREAQEARENVESNLQARYDKANEHYEYHQNAHFDATTQLRALLRDDTATPEQIAAARARVAETNDNVNIWSTARGEAKMKLVKLPEERARLEKMLEDRLDVGEAEENLKAAQAEHAEARKLENVISYKIPYFLRRFGDSVNTVLFGATTSKLLRVFGPRWAPTPEQVNHIKELSTEELRAILRDGVQQTHFHDIYGAIAGPQYAMDLHRNGVMARRYAFRPIGWGTMEPDGGQGLDAFAKYLFLRFGDPTESAHAWIQTLAHMAPTKAAREAELARVTKRLAREHEAAKGDFEARKAEYFAEGERNKRLTEEFQATYPDHSALPEGSMEREDASNRAREIQASTDRMQTMRMDLRDAEHRARQAEDAVAHPQYHMTPEAQAWQEALKAARDSVRAYLDEPAMRHFIANAEMMQSLRDGRIVGRNATLAEAKDELADRISADLTFGLMRNGRMNDNLLEQLSMADQIGTPDASWIAHNVPTDERPEQTIGQLWGVHNPLHHPHGFPRGWTPILSKVYGKVVTDQIDALSRNPILAAMYLNARKNTKPWEEFLVDKAGWDPESARQVVMRTALRSAEQEVYRHIDNPWVASHFAMLSRNFLNFERAQEDWLRRWARTLRDNPSIIQKAQLTLHGAEAAGLVEQDPTDPTALRFVYPGSALAIKVFNGVMDKLGLGESVQLPVTQELTSQLQFISPSLQQPFAVTAAPIITLPFRAIANTVGQHHGLLMNSIDEALNGKLGAGRSVWEQLLPPTINRIIRGVIEQSDPASTYGQAYTNATMTLASTGYFDKMNGSNPTEISNAQDAIGVQTRNAALLNILFGFGLPAAPGIDAAASKGGKPGTGSEPDWSAHILGYTSLKAEAQEALQKLGPTRFREWWAAVHPHELLWDPTLGVGSHTKSGVANAYLPATVNAAKWLDSNPDFLKEYGGAGGVAAYLVPGYQNITGYDAQGNPIIAPSPNDQFNELAYRSELQDHMREYKPLNELLPDIIIARGEQEYYTAKDQADAQIQAAEDAGDHTLARQLEDQWSKTKRDIYARNPLLQAKQESYATGNSSQAVAIAQLQRMVKHPDAAVTRAVGEHLSGISLLLQAWSDYQAGTTALSGRRGNAATAARSALSDSYQAQIKAVAQQDPQLADLVRGVFRYP